MYRAKPPNSNKMKCFGGFSNAHYHRLLILERNSALDKKELEASHFLRQPFVHYVDIDKEPRCAEDS